MTAEGAIAEARRRWGNGYASDRHWREDKSQRFMVTDCRDIYGVSAESFEAAFDDAESRASRLRTAGGKENP